MGSDRRNILIASLIGIVPCVWMALLIAPYGDEGVFEIMMRLDEVFADPFHIQIVEGSMKCVLLFLLLYGLGMDTYNQSYGMRGNYTKNMQLHGRELMTPDEVRMLDNRFSLLFIRGERPVKDLKYDILKHPNIELTADGSAEPYRHGEADKAVFSIELDGTLPENYEETGEIADGELELLSEEDVITLYET